MSLDENKPNELAEETGATADTAEHMADIVYGYGDPEEEPIEQESENKRFDAFAQPVFHEEKARKSKMNKRTRTLLLTALVAVVLALAVLAVTLFPIGGGASGSDVSGDTSGSDTSDNSTNTTYTLLDKTGEEEDTVVVKQLEITNADDTYTVVYNEKDKVYKLKGYEDLTLDTDGTDSLSASISSLIASDKVTAADNLADFGLDKPKATVTGTYHDDTTATLYIGNETPTTGNYYVSVKDKEGVYICSSDAVSAFLATGAMYVQTSLITAPEVKSDDANGTPALREVTLSGKSHPEPLTIRRKVDADGDTFSFYTYIITQPYKRGVADEAANQLSAFTSLTANQAVILHPTADQKATMGFNDPLTVMNLTLCVITTNDEENSATGETASVTEFYNTSKAKLTVGSKDEDGNYLVMMDGIDAIFLVNASSLTGVIDRNFDNTVTDLLFLKDITSVKQIDVTVNGVKHTLTLTHHPEEEDRDLSLEVKNGDSQYSTPDFRTLYQLMMGLSRYESLEKEPTGEPTLELAVIDTNGKTHLSAQFYPASGSIYHVRTSEGELFTTKASSITHFIKQVNNLLNGKTVLVESY